MKNELLTIGQVRDDIERSKAITFLAERMFKSYGTILREDSVPECLFVARQGNMIVATMAIEFGQKNVLLPFEHIYDVDIKKSPIPLVREKCIYYSKWHANHKQAGLLVYFAITKFALQYGYSLGSFIVKSPILKYFNLLSNNGWHLIPDARLKFNSLDEKDYGFFMESSPVLPYVAYLKPNNKVLQKIVEDLGMEKAFVIEL